MGSRRERAVTLAVFARAGARFFRSVAIARALGPGLQGTVATLTVATDFSARVVSLGLGQAADRAVAESETHGRAAVGTNLLWTWIVSPLAVAIGIGIAALTLVNSGATTFVVGSASIALWIASQQVGSAAESFHLARGHARIVAIGYWAAAGISAIGGVTLYVLGVLSVSAAVLLNALPTVIPYVYFSLKSHVRLRDRLPLRSQLHFGVRAYPALLSNTVNQRIDMIFVAVLLGFADAGIYSVAIGVNQALSTFGVAYSMHTQMRMNRPELLQSSMVRTEMRRAVGRVIWFGAATAALTAPFILLLYGSAYSSSVIPALVLLPGTIALVVGQVGSRATVISGRPGVASIAEIIGVVTTVALLLPLVALLGVAGAALTSSIAYVARAVYLWWAAS